MKRKETKMSKVFCEHDIIFSVSRHGGPVCLKCENADFQTKLAEAEKKRDWFARLLRHAQANWIEESESFHKTINKALDGKEGTDVIASYLADVIEDLLKAVKGE